MNLQYQSLKLPKASTHALAVVPRIDLGKERANTMPVGPPSLHIRSLFVFSHHLLYQVAEGNLTYLLLYFCKHLIYSILVYLSWLT